MKLIDQNKSTAHLSLFLLLFVCVFCVKKQVPTPEPLPEASYTYSPNVNLVAPVSVSFINTSQNANSYIWSYAGQSATDENIILTFNKAGTYPVSLKAFNNGNTDTYTETIVVSEAQSQPTNNLLKADFTYSPSQNLVAPVKISFKNTSQNAESYTWLISGDGDKTTVNGVDFDFEFKHGGMYTIKLTATKNGENDVITKSITVDPPPVAFIEPGKAVFWATGNWDYVEIETESATYQKTANGPYWVSQYIGFIKTKNTSTAPQCGADGFFTTERPVKSYSYRAIAYLNSGAKVAEQTGTYTVESNRCKEIRIDFAATPSQSTLSFKNQAYTPITLTVGTVTKKINPGAIGTFTGQASEQVVCKGETGVVTSNGELIGLKILGNDFIRTFPTSDDLQISLLVSNNFFIYQKHIVHYRIFKTICELWTSISVN
ncbi:hypothetical protein CLV98_107100 [Dyadobacter jejuensis]|uniref:PKD/Chitinase domain-containing protein n=1 Tax=Dyadobacter jejuensis TaxID=1082580 RepID=A0A316AI73_9BACT|nr:PKD domain-containing protein [Dyadobacter jejuensis]PWJ57393.1 hypothetical protein CLV98_107100 [Dyadobacter jejuensis]